MLHSDKPFARARRTVLALFLLALAALVVSTILATTAGWSLFGAVVSGALAAFFGVMLLVILGAGIVRGREIADFVGGDRPMVRWTYTPDEAASIRAERWEEERADWKVQFGCLTGLFGIVGVLVGIMGYFSGELDPLIATGAGLAFGAAVGGVVALANHAGARAERGATGRVSVALGIGEFTFDGEYFRERGAEHVIERMRLEDGAVPDLVIETWSHPWYQRTPLEREWHIPVPSEQVDAVRRLVESAGR
jgi:hypothetical protein